MTDEKVRICTTVQPTDLGPWLNERVKEYDPETDFANLADSDSKERREGMLPRGIRAIEWANNEICALRAELKQRREDEEWLLRNTPSISIGIEHKGQQITPMFHIEIRKQQGMNVLRSVGIAPTLHAAIAAAKGEG